MKKPPKRPTNQPRSLSGGAPAAKASLSASTTTKGIADSGWSHWWIGKRPVLSFGLKFGAFMGLFYVVSLIPFSDETVFPAYLRANAQLSNRILQLLGQSTHVVENSIQSAQFSVTIRRGCDAIEPSWLFCSAVFAFPAKWIQQLVGAIAGVVLMQGVNLLRIVTLYFIGIHAPKLFSTAHLEIWPAVFILLAVLLWTAWISWSRPARPKSGTHAVA